MIGWHIRIYRPADQGPTPPMGHSAGDLLLAEWQADLRGIDWLDDLVRTGRASGHGDGYPYVYTARAEVLLPTIVAAPPWKPRGTGKDTREVLEDRWGRDLTVDHEAVSSCCPRDWLLADVWDES